MSVFAVVRDFEALHAACDSISELLAVCPDGVETTLLGIWVEAGMAADVDALWVEKRSSSADLLVEGIQGTCGIDGHWTLFWLSGQRTHRTGLVKTLLGVRPGSSETNPSSRCFVPVFDCAMPQPEVQAEVACLRQIPGAHVLAPCYQESPSGRVLLAPVYGRGPSAVQ
jgi:hypothetical protein